MKNELAIGFVEKNITEFNNRFVYTMKAFGQEEMFIIVNHDKYGEIFVGIKLTDKSENGFYLTVYEENSNYTILEIRGVLRHFKSENTRTYWEMYKRAIRINATGLRL